MGPPTIINRIKQTLGRALRETGQAIDRLGIRTEQLLLTSMNKQMKHDDPYIYDDHLSRHRNLFPLLKNGRPILSPQVSYVAPCSTLIGCVRVGDHSSIWYGSILQGDTCNNGSSFDSDIISTELEKEIFPLNPHRLSHEDEQLQNKLLQQSSSSNNNKSVLLLQGDKPVDDEEEKEGEDTVRVPLNTAYIDDDILIGGGIYVGNYTSIQDNCVLTSKINHTIIGDHVTIKSNCQIHSSIINDNVVIGSSCIVNKFVVIEHESIIEPGTVIAPGTYIPQGELWTGNPAYKVRDLTMDERKQLKQNATEYVKVAEKQSGAMELGGNLPNGKERLMTLLASAPDASVHIDDNKQRSNIHLLLNEKEERMLLEEQQLSEWMKQRKQTLEQQRKQQQRMLARTTSTTTTTPLYLFQALGRYQRILLARQQQQQHRNNNRHRGCGSRRGQNSAILRRQEEHRYSYPNRNNQQHLLLLPPSPSS